MTDKKSETKTNDPEDGKTQPGGVSTDAAKVSSTDARLSASGKPGVVPGAGGAGTDPSAPTPMVGGANPNSAADRAKGE